ncbi:MAG: HEAT repeat domain-containing protein [Myxococcota bacterium]
MLVALAPTGGPDERWEQELVRFLTEQVQDVTDPDSLDLVSAAAVALGRSLVARGRRTQARGLLEDVLERAKGYGLRQVPWAVVLELARVEAGLGRHDAAEALLRKIRLLGPEALHGPAWLRTAEIATQRQEPWAEEALSDALAAGLDEPDKLAAAILRIERAVRQDRVDDAVRAADGLTRLSRRVGAPELDAAVALVLGDVARLRGDVDKAAAGYARARALSGVAEGGSVARDPEVLCRALLRQAELAWAAGDREEAVRLAMAGADGFRRWELPVREAWALLRLARYLAESDPPRAQQARGLARERFVEADLASGVAATDSVQGDLGSLSSGALSWHLERAAAHARARHDAQRARPPWDRSDAERPERRLGAHRLAIAACGVGVVQALAREMEACARAASVGRGRPTDPPVLRYVAAVDLLSGHRSYEAARVLLDHLFTKGIDGVMLRALQGAIARSPNAALVDGLLRCVERPGDRPAAAVAAAAELLGLRREPVATEPLERLLGAASPPAARKAAVTALGRIGDRSVVDSVAGALDDPRMAEQAALALLMLGDRRGVDFHGRAMVDGRTDLSGSPGEIVGRYGGPDHLLLLVRAAEGDGERALGALQGLGLLGDPRGVSTLLGALHARDRRMVEVACGALTILSGRVDDPTEPGVRARWNEWWAESEAKLGAGVRHRHGRPFHCGLLIDAMEDADPYVRRTAYDELVITSGEAMPFDADGPWRVQQAHLAAWRRWWAGAAGSFPPGRWLLDGEVLA